jgi:putative PIN family toxin of toxin-antitoxin system
MQIVIVDTNVLVAGLITANAQSPTVRIVDGMLRGDVVFLLSPELLREYRSVLMRPKLVAFHGLADHEVDQLLTELAANALWREPPARSAAPDQQTISRLAPRRLEVPNQLSARRWRPLHAKPLKRMNVG